MIEDIIALLHLFQEKSPDKDTNKIVLGLAENKEQWKNAHDIFSTIREKNLKAIENKENIKESQYCFEEVCAKSIFNIYCYSFGEDGQFDPDSPYWLIKNALSFAYSLGLPKEEVINIVAPNK